MIDFKKPTLEDKIWISEKLKTADFRGSEYCFGNLFIWRDVSNTKAANVDDFLCVVSTAKDSPMIYNYPVGKEVTKDIITILAENSLEQGYQAKFRGIFEQQKQQMEEMFPDEYEFTTVEGEWDYLYPVEKLTALAGKKYHGKRNHIARFRDAGDWTYEAVTMDNLEECIEMNRIWCKEYGCGKSESAKLEQCAVKQSFDHFSELSFEGGLLRKAGKVIAFSIGEPLNSDTYIVHIEKAFPDIQGAYPFINQQFVQHNMQNFQYVNREEDMGDEGLRRAKLSYKPDPLLVKYTAVKK